MGADGGAGHEDQENQGRDVGKGKEEEQPGQGSDLRKGESNEEPPLKFRGERGEAAAGRLSSRQDIDGRKGRDHAQDPERERAHGEWHTRWGIRGSREPGVQQVEPQGEVQSLRHEELDGQESEAAAECGRSGRRGLGWLSGHPSIILR